MSAELRQMIEGLTKRTLTRRDFIKRASALGLSMGAIGSILAACGGGAATPAPTETATAAATETGAAETATAEATETPAATATQASSGEAGSKVLNIRISPDIVTLDPAFWTTLSEEYVDAPVILGLVTWKPNTYEIVNELAETIEQTDDTTVTFKLKEGIKWHKGYGEVTTEDVKFSFERIADPEVNSAYASDWAALDHVEIVDKYNGKIILKEPFAPLWKTTLPEGRGYIHCKKFFEEVGADKYPTNILGCGPYMFEEWRPQERIILKKNPDYFGEQPYWDQINLIPIDDEKTAEVALESGDVDFSMVSLASFDRISDTPGLKTAKFPALAYYWIGMNMENPKLSDINVRQAIRYGVDVPSILQAVYMGQAEQAYSLIPPGTLGFWEDAPQYQRDVVKAKEFLGKAGVSSLELTMTVEDITEFRTYAEITQQNLAEIGITVNINTLESATFWGMKPEQQQQLELFTANYVTFPDPSWSTMWFTSDQIDVWNWMRWNSPEFDDLHKQGLVELDDAKREDIYIRMQQLWDGACHTIWVTHNSWAYGWKESLEPAFTPNGVVQTKEFRPA